MRSCDTRETIRCTPLLRNNSKYAYDSITEPIRMDIRRDLNEIEHIHITPFYETVTDDVIVQSYTGDTIKASHQSRI